MLLSNVIRILKSIPIITTYIKRKQLIDIHIQTIFIVLHSNYLGWEKYTKHIIPLGYFSKMTWVVHHSFFLMVLKGIDVCFGYLLNNREYRASTLDVMEHLHLHVTTDRAMWRGAAHLTTKVKRISHFISWCFILNAESIGSGTKCWCSKLPVISCSPGIIDHSCSSRLW